MKIKILSSKTIKTTFLFTFLLFLATFLVGCSPQNNTNNQPINQQTQEKIEIKEEKITEKIPFETKEETDSNLEIGKTKVKQEGVEGEKVITFEITLKDGKEVSRKQIKEEITKKPAEKIIAKGTKEKSLGGSSSGSSCSGGYINVDGNCIKSPGSNPAGASARCRDGTYSYSQHRQGTCSRHGGVAEWY